MYWRHLRPLDGRWFEGRRNGCRLCFEREVVEFEVDNRIQNHPFHGLEERSAQLVPVIEQGGYIILIVLVFSAIIILTVILGLILG